MIENQYNSQQLPSSWTINDFKEKSNQRIIRKFINSAIYVEKAVAEMPPSRKTSSLSVTEDCNQSKLDNVTKQCNSCNILNTKFSNHNSNSASYLENNDHKTKISLFQNRLNSSQENIRQKTPESGYRTNDQSSNHSIENSDSSFQSELTVKPRDFKSNHNINSELRLSLTCLNTNRTDRTSTLDPKEKQEIIQNWLAKKETEQRRKALQEAKLAKEKEEKRQKLVEKERETFKKWLAEKKKEEERKRIQKEIEEQELKLKEAEKEKRKVENEISFNLWLRKKKKYDLERKIRDKLALLHIYEEKQIRMEENEKAYQEWLKNAKNRQRPIPMNKGLQSLCSSASVHYINPLPWTPNIDPVPKASSQ